MNCKGMSSVLCVWMISVLSLSLAAAQAARAEVAHRASSQTVYVPSYARVLTKDGSSQPMASTLVVHNIDPELTISVTRLEYYSRAGAILESFVTAPVTLAPFQSTHALVPIDSLGAGIGANFIVAWTSQDPALAPIVEAVMIGGGGTQGISFASRGRVIDEKP